MFSDDGRWALTFNGEIYNYLEVRETLLSKGWAFRSQTDTEVLFVALQEWGEGALERLSGMFAFAFWDDWEGRLLLVRDRLGVKPLYYSQAQGSFCFASEVSSILASGLLEPTMSPNALESYLRLLWIPEPATLFAGILKVEPGSTVSWDRTGARVRRYWDVPPPHPKGGDDQSAIPERVLSALQGAMKRQLRSDVPVGAFLSGGIDSTAVLSLAVGAGVQSIRTYSIGFATADRLGEGALDDLRFARAAAAEFGVPHQEIVLSPDVVELFPKMVRHLEDPVADPAALNCYLICHAARETSTVLLSGTGGDELFGGYRKYTAESLVARYRQIPAPLRGAILEPLVRSLPIAIGRAGIRPVRFAKRFLRHSDDSMFNRFLGYSSYYDAAELEELLGGDPNADLDPDVGVEPLRSAWDRRDGGQAIDRMTYVDLKYYLPGLGLAYMDKASMAASVEVRVPLIDDEVVDVVSRLPDNFKVQGLRTKVVLREVMKGRIPDKILRRPKAPFAAPLRTWLRRDLKPLIGDYLSPGRVLARGILNPGVVHRMVREHQQGREDHSLRIWALLTLEIWIQEFYDNRARFKMPERVPEVELISTGER